MLPPEVMGGIFLHMNTTIFTIGYAGFTVGEFVDELAAHGVSAVIDVRSVPFSHHDPEYDSPNISRSLMEKNIRYESYANEFGARQQDRRFYAHAGYMDFEIFAESGQFRDGVNKVLAGMNDYVFAFMCAEKNPINCHRAVLVARAFHELGIRVIHIMPDVDDITHDELENMLLEKYCPERVIELMCTSDWLCEAYRRCNTKIGWRLENNDSVHDRLHQENSGTIL